MSKTLLQLKKDLKAFAKRCKDFKYTDSALLVFLLSGLLIPFGSLSAAETRKDSTINNQMHQISTSINQIRTDFKRARAENNKLVKGTNLELIQLMEQGDHVVKSPWSSWQYGINYFYNDWHGHYRGRGDKIDSFVYKRDDSVVNRSIYPGKIETKYGATTLGLIREPNAAMDVSAALTPKSVDKVAPAFTVQGAGGGFPNFATRVVKAPEAPSAPQSPTISVSPAPSIVFIGEGFGQGTSIGQNSFQGVYAQNFTSYTGNNAIVELSNTKGSISSGSMSLTGGTDTVYNNSNDVVQPGGFNAFISHVQDNDVNVNGNYDVTSTASHNLLFISLNPYEYGRNTNTDHKFSFNGHAVLHNNGSSTLVGFEHQLLANGPGGGENFANVLNKSVTSIAENKGVIELNSGKKMIGMMIDTEYDKGHEATHGFIKIPQTNNEGTIKISAGASESAGIDYGFYYSASPNSSVKIGNIIIDGKKSYGYRQSDYTSYSNSHGSNNAYYDNMNTVSGSNGSITINGEENVGMAIFQGKTTGDPISNFQNINITVNGTKNVGFLREIPATANDANKIVLDSTKLGNIMFGNSATDDNALIRSADGKVELAKAISVSTPTGALRNSVLQAVKNGKVSTTTSGKITVTSGDTVYGVTAGFDSGGAAELETAGDIDMTAKNSIGIAVDTGRTGINTASKVTMTGKNNTAIYNSGTFSQEGNITVDGEKSNGIFNKGTFKLTNNTVITAKNGANGIYNTTGGTFVNPDKLTVNVVDSTKKGVGVYSDATKVTLDGIKVDVNGGASAIVAKAGTIDVKNNSKVSYNGEGYALYTLNNGKIDMTGSELTLDGQAVGFVVDGGSGSYSSGVTFGTGSTVKILSNDVILMGVTHPTTLNLSTFDSTLLSAAGGLTNTMINATAAPNYKLAVIEGLNGAKSFVLDNDPLSSDGSFNKSLAVSTPTSQSYKFSRNLLIQRSILDVNADVKAVLSSADANTIKNVASGAPVIGLDISSSTGAASNAETGINVNGKTVTVDRTDAGDGAIGLYANFGKININSGTLNVETDTANTVNDQAVGVYAVNGSEVNNNSGNINVGGNNSIGILGLAYREDAAGNPVLNEFGGVAGQGKATINNDGNIKLDGTGAKGVFVKNNNSASSVADSVATNKANGKITMSGAGAVGMYADKATLNNYGTIDLKAGSNAKIGMYGINNSDMTNWATGNIIVGDSVLSSASDVPNIGMYTADSVTLNNYGTLDIKDSSYGMYGENIHAYGTSKIKVAQNGVGIFSKGTAGTGTVTLDSGSEITTSASVKGKEAVGVFTAGTNPVNINDNGSKMDLKDWTFGYVIKAPGTLTTNASSNVTMDNETVYAYSDNNSSVIKNYTPIKATGNRNYGIYSSGTVDNYGNMDLKSGNGNGNIGIYSTAGTATNWATIDVGKTDKSTKSYGIGMATGYYDGTSSRNQGTIINKGTINVTEENSIGMYAVGRGSKAINAAGGIINLSGKNTIGMYIDQEAEGENYGTITGNGDNLKGVVVANQGKFKNYGTIQITGNKGIGIYTDKGVVSADGIDGPGAVNTGSFKNVYESQPTDEKVEGSVTIKVPPKATPVTVTINGVQVPITGVDTNVASPSATEVTVTSPSGVTVLDLAKSGLMNFPSGSKATSVGMYVDTSGIKYTNPIQGLSNLAGLTDINLYFGTEAARYTNARAIELGDNIIKPYNDALASLVTTGTVLNTNSSSLTWLAIPTKSAATGLYDKVYLVKIPYTDFVSAKDPNTYNFLNGLEQRYGVEGLGTREKELFNKLNDLGKGEQHIFTQAVDEMKGHQYANVQQRINATGNTLDNEFGYLRNEWRNPTKQNNKIKVFGARDEYNTDTAGIIDYKSNAYGVAYVHEDEKIKMGNSSGWYAGAVTNRFKFKDIGHSRENQTQLKAGIFKTMSPKKDYNGALQWTIGGDVFVGINDMKRRYLVVDDVFQAKSDYHSYGAALKTDLGYDIRMSERTHLRPYGALKMEYGRFNDIKEDRGEMRLEVKGNDYFSVKPEVGMEFKYVQPLAVRTNLTVGLSAAYENEIGKLQKGNRAKVRYTTADWYNLEKEKEDRRGNGKFDLNIGVDNTRFGVTVNAGYDTKGNNVRGGIGFRAIY